MLHIISGNDYQSNHTYYQKLLETLQEKRPQSEVIHLSQENFSVEKLNQLSSSVGLFDKKSIVILKNALTANDHKKYLVDHLDKLHKSENAFIVVELSFSLGELKKIAESQVPHISHTLEKKIQNTNLFVLGDLLLQKNKQKLILELYSKTREGFSVEEIFGILLWQCKSLHLCHTHNQKQSGLKSFVYNKCKKSTWSRDETIMFHLQLIDTYHSSRRGGLNLENRLELLLLNI